MNSIIIWLQQRWPTKRKLHLNNIIKQSRAHCSMSHNYYGCFDTRSCRIHVITIFVFTRLQYYYLIENHFGNVLIFIAERFSLPSCKWRSTREKKTWKLIFSSKIHERITLGRRRLTLSNSYSIYSNYIWITLSPHSHQFSIGMLHINGQAISPRLRHVFMTLTCDGAESEQ